MASDTLHETAAVRRPAEQIVAGAEQKAAEMGLKMNIAVVDDGGHMIAFARMDGARPASGAVSPARRALQVRLESFAGNRP